MGIVLQFQSLPPDKRRCKAQPRGHGPKQGVDTADIVIFPGVRKECDFADFADDPVSATPKHCMARETPAE